MRYELSDYECAAIKPMLPNKPRGVARGTTGVSSTVSFGCCGPGHRGAIGQTGSVRTHLLQSLRSLATGWLWGRIMNTLAGAHDAPMQMIDTSIVRMHQHGADQQDSCGSRHQWPAGPTRTVAGEAHDNRLACKLLSHLTSGTMLLADRGYDAD
jgi:hypothetical protein